MKTEKLTKAELRAYVRQEFMKRWTPSRDTETVYAEIAVDTKYSISYIRKLCVPVNDLKNSKQYVVGEVLELLEEKFTDDQRYNEYPINFLWQKLAGI